MSQGGTFNISHRLIMKLNLTAIILPQRLSVSLCTGKASSTEFPDVNIAYCLHNSFENMNTEIHDIQTKTAQLIPPQRPTKVIP